MTKQILAFLFCFKRELNPYTPLSLSLRPLSPPIHDCAYGALITFDCAYGAFITLGANATTCRRQSIIYKYPPSTHS